MADWKAFQIPLPLSQVAKPVQQILEALLILLDLVKTILDTVKTFLVDFGNPIKALAEALLNLLSQLIAALQASGCYAYFDVPDPIHDPNFSRVAGGFAAFIERFKGSLYDTKDFNRPQPNALTTSGFILFVIDAEDIVSLILGVKAFLRLFGKAWKTPRYEAPANFKVTPVGDHGDPILAVSSVFLKGPIEAIELRWDLPTTVESPEPGFSDAFTQVASEFVPPHFLIEKSVDLLPTSQKIDISAMSNPNSAGLVTINVPQQVDSTLASRFSQKDGTTVLSTQPLRDDQQEPFVKFQKYIKATTGPVLLGAVSGTFRLIDNDVAPGHVYYYRIRSYSGDLNIDDTAHKINGLPTTYKALKAGTGNNSRISFLEWPTTGSAVVMGKPSGIVRTAIAPDLGGFNVIDNLKRLFEVAFSLDFHIPVPAKNPDGSTPSFDANGNPIAPTPPTILGKGSLTNVAGSLAGLNNNLFIDKLAALDAPGKAFDPNSLQTTTMPWQRFNVQRNAFRLANDITAGMLQQTGGEAQTFKDFMTGPLPRGPISTQGLLAGKTTLSDIVFAFTTPQSAKDSSGKQLNNEKVLTTYTSAYQDLKLRQNMLVVISFIKNFSLGGVPPDWIAVSPLRDLIPWSGQILYDILSKIEALLDSYQGFLTEITKFVDLLERKIDAMENFVKFLVQILDFLQDLNFGVFMLAANNLNGDVSKWVSTIDNAGGNKPPSGPGGYTAGIALGYALFDATALATALQTIFGG